MKSSTKKIQLFVLFAILALNKFWLQTDSSVPEMASQASVSIKKSQGGDVVVPLLLAHRECDEVKSRSRKTALEQALEFSDDTQIDLVSIGWDLRIFSQVCVKGGKEEVITSYKLENSVLQNPDSETEACIDCLEDAINLNASFSGHIIGEVTEINLEDLATAINAGIEKGEKQIKKYIRNFDKNKSKVELDCTRSWREDGTGLTNKVKSAEEIRNCRLATLSEYEFDSEKKRYKYFKKHFYNQLKKDISYGDEEVLEETRLQLEDFSEHDSGAIRRAAQQLVLLDRHTTQAFRIHQGYGNIRGHCNQKFQAASGLNPDSFHAQILLSEAKNCRQYTRFNEGMDLRYLSNRARSEISSVVGPGRSDPLDLRGQADQILKDFDGRLRSIANKSTSIIGRNQNSVIVEEFSREETDSILGAKGLIPSFLEPGLSIPSNLDVTVTGRGPFSSVGD